MAKSLEDLFKAFSKFGDSSSNGTEISLTQIDKWLKQCGVVDGKAISTTDTGICFGKIKKKKINFAEFKAFLQDLANYRKQDYPTIEKKILAGGSPGTSKTTTAQHGGGVDRLTDTSKYTGSHKERFDETGKGKGIEGREDATNNTGYTGQYKGAGTYDDKTKK